MKFFYFPVFLFCLFPFFPQDGMAAAPSFTVNMSEAVTVTGTPRIAVDVGGVTRYADYASGSGTSSLTFTYSPQEGDLDLDGVTVSSPVDLNGGTITDLNGNPETDLTFTVPNTSGVKIDYPSLSMDFTADDYILSGTHYNSLTSFLSTAGGTFSRNSVGTYFNSSGTMQTASANVPRFDYDPVTHAAKGILIEGMRTNILLQSNAFATSPWISCNAMTTAGTTTAPDGSSIPIYNVDTNGCLYQDVSVTIGNQLTHSIWIKANQSATIGFRNPGQGSAGFISTNIAVDTTWQHYEITATATQSFTRFLIDNRTSNGYGVAGLQLSFFGGQIEVGGMATSYIPTTTATVTRQVDNVLIPTGAWYNQNSGSVFTKVEWNSFSGVVGWPMLWQFSDGTSSNRWNLYYDQSTNRLGVDGYTGGAGQGYFPLIPATAAGSVKNSAAQSLNNSNAAYNGAINTLDTSWTPPPVTRLSLYGATATKWISSFKYYPARVSDTQLQLLTQ